LQQSALSGQTNAINLGNFTTAPTTFTSGPNKGLYSGGFGTIVPEFRGLPSRTGAVVMEQQTRGLGKPGQEITLGSVNPQVFGTPGF
jgi:hypothetical protein